MASRQGSASEEFFQIVFLTLLMTGGGLGLIFLIFHFWLVPNHRVAAERAASEYRDMSGLLLSDEMQALRAQAKAQEEAGESSQSQQVIVRDQLARHGLKLGGDSFPKLDGSAERYSFKVEAAPLRSILLFVASLRSAKKTLEVASLDLNRPNRRTEGDDLFDASIELYDYSPPK